MTRQILQNTDPRLRVNCVAPAPTGAKLVSLFEELIAAMRYPKGVGLAAPQIGELCRAIVVRVPHGRSYQHYEIANPELVEVSADRSGQWEGCLSFPDGFRAMVIRPKHVIVRGLNRREEPIRVEARDFVARVILHELDHLAGVLMTDKAKRTDQRKKKRTL